MESNFYSRLTEEEKQILDIYNEKGKLKLVNKCQERIGKV